MMMQGLKVAALFTGYAAVGAGGDLAARGGDECRYEAERRVGLDAAGVTALLVDAGSGELEVEGTAGSDRVEAVARACASEEDDLASLQLTLERRGSELVLSAHYPDDRGRRWERGGYARLDLVVRVPRGMALDVEDSSGGMRISGVGALDIDDSSGSIVVEDVDGPVRIDDSSGEVEVRGVRGDVEVEDGSGEIVLVRVEGSVRVDDGSGSIEVEEVGRDVVVVDDGSGSIRVRGVGGDFRVESDGSGSIRFSEVAGTVEIPRDKRKGRRGG